MTFDRDAVREMHFDAVQWCSTSGTATLGYHFEPGPRFSEVFEFGAGAELSPALERSLRWLHLAAGVSYFKLAVPPAIVTASPLTAPEAEFFTTLYQAGLAEFAYRNGLAVPLDVSFNAAVDYQPVAATLQPGIVVPLGGGKDSLVTCELLSGAGIDFRTLSVGSAPRIDDVAVRVDRERVIIRRRLDASLARLNQQGAYNGHVPISGILAFVKLCGAFVHGYDTVVMSNERSADEPTLVADNGAQVNHQYSKSSQFERDFQSLIAHGIESSFQYFSLLRPWSELAIARQFANGDRYDDVFSSCNANFRQTGSATQRWCRDCPKCRFVFLALAPFMEIERLVDIFGGNLLADSDQLGGFEALLGLTESKPFECVGEIGEARAAMQVLMSHAAWRDQPVVASLRAHRSWQDDRNSLGGHMLPTSVPHLPERFSGLFAGALPW